MNPALVIGYGNTLRGDDAAGPIVAEAVAELGRGDIDVCACHQLTPELAARVAAARCVIFIDAADGPPGPPAVRAIDPGLPVRPAWGHASDPRAILELAKSLYGRVPPAWLLTVPAQSFDLGAGLSPACAAAVGPAVRMVCDLCGPAPDTLGQGGPADAGYGGAVKVPA